MDAFELWCWRRLLSPLDYKEIQPVHPKDQSWVFIGRTDAEAETPILWPPDAKSWHIWKRPWCWESWGQEKGMTEDEMAGWHHRLDGHGFGWTLGVGDGQGGLVCYDSWGSQSRTWLSDWTELNWYPWRTKVFSFAKVKLIFLACVFGVIAKKPLPNLRSWRFYAYGSESLKFELLHLLTDPWSIWISFFVSGMR